MYHDIMCVIGLCLRFPSFLYFLYSSTVTACYYVWIIAQQSLCDCLWVLSLAALLARSACLVSHSLCSSFPLEY